MNAKASLPLPEASRQQERGLPEAPRRVVDADPADEAAQVDKVREPLVDVGQLLDPAGHIACDLAGRVGAGLHARSFMVLYGFPLP